MGQHFTLGAGPAQIMGQHDVLPRAAPAVWLSPPMPQTFLSGHWSSPPEHRPGQFSIPYIFLFQFMSWQLSFTIHGLRVELKVRCLSIIIIIIITRLMTQVKVIHRVKNRKCGWSRISEGKLGCKVQSLPNTNRLKVARQERSETISGGKLFQTAGAACEKA